MPDHTVLCTPPPLTRKPGLLWCPEGLELVLLLDPGAHLLAPLLGAKPSHSLASSWPSALFLRSYSELPAHLRMRPRACPPSEPCLGFCPFPCHSCTGFSWTRLIKGKS